MKDNWRPDAAFPKLRNCSCMYFFFLLSDEKLRLCSRDEKIKACVGRSGKCLVSGWFSILALSCVIHYSFPLWFSSNSFFLLTLWNRFSSRKPLNNRFPPSICFILGAGSLPIRYDLLLSNNPVIGYELIASYALDCGIFTNKAQRQRKSMIKTSNRYKIVSLPVANHLDKCYQWAVSGKQLKEKQNELKHLPVMSKPAVGPFT